MTTPCPSLAWSRPARTAMAFAFLAIIVSPSIDMLLDISPKKLLQEKREPASYPVRGPLDPEAFETAFNDRFGFREAFVYGHNWIDIHLFGVSPTKKALIGKDGWLYLSESVDDYRGLNKLSPLAMEEWRHQIAAKASFFAAHGIVYCLVVAPSKESIYPEFLPFRIQQGKHENSTDQLEHYIAGRAPCDLLDLRPPFLEEKRAHGTKLFLKTDTHWNQTGALLAAREIVGRLRQRLPDIPLPADGDYRPVPQILPGGDLAEMIGFSKSLTEMDTNLTTRDSPPQTVATPAWAVKPKLIVRTLESTSNHPGHTRRVVLCADSFGITLAPLLTPEFQRLTYIRLTFAKREPGIEYYPEAVAKIIETERPDVVIELVTERFFRSASKTLFSPKQ